MSHGRHSKQETSKWKKRVLGLPVVGWLIGGFAATALAVVGFIVLMGATGSISSTTGLDMRWGVDGPNPNTFAGSVTCDANYVGTDQLQITTTDALPGSACTYALSVRNMADEGQARLGGFQLDSPGFASGNVRATVAQCGQIANGGGSPVTVSLTIWIDDIAPGETFTFDPAVDGLLWSIPAEYDPAGCEQT